MAGKDIKAELEAVRQSYASSLLDKADGIQNNWKSLLQDWNEDILHALHIIVHGLAGSAETFGFADITATARPISNQIKLLDKNQQPDNDTINQLSKDLDRLQEILRLSADIK